MLDITYTKTIMSITEILQQPGNTLVLISGDDLKSAIDYAAHNHNSNSALKVKPEPEQPITTAEAEEFTGKTRQTLIKWRKNGLITAHIMSGRCYYFKSELLAAFKNNQ